MAGNKLKQTAATRTISTKRPKMDPRRLKRSKAKKEEEPNLKRTLFFLNVPAWLNHFNDILDIFRPFGPIAKMDLFGSDMFSHWGIVDYHHPVAEVAKESLSDMMDIRVASAEKSEERRKKRLRQQGKLEGPRPRTISGRRRRAASKAKVVPQSASTRALEILLRNEHIQQHSKVNQSPTKEQHGEPLREPLEQPEAVAIDHAAQNYDGDGMIVDAVYGEWDPLWESILCEPAVNFDGRNDEWEPLAEYVLRESAAALGFANAGNPLLVVTPPEGGGSSSRDSGAGGREGSSRPVAGGNGMFSYTRSA